MSLVSVKNLVAPLTNSTHLVTIILITILFAIFRLQGGSINVTRDSERGDVSTGRAPLSGEIKVFTKNPSKSEEVRELPDKGTISISPEDQDLLGEMIGSKPLPPKREANPKVNKREPAPARPGNSLEDIERSLGIR